MSLHTRQMACSCASQKAHRAITAAHCQEKFSQRVDDTGSGPWEARVHHGPPSRGGDHTPGHQLATLLWLLGNKQQMKGLDM